ncbi:MAG TPA: sterol desaturase family protein [Rhizomicrobium sp.]
MADYAFTFAPAILGHLISLPALIGAFAIAKAFEPALDALLGPALPHSAFSLVGELVYLAGWIVIYDFGIFFAHWGMHKSSLLWEFHKVHHSAEVLNPLTVFRQHPVDAIVLDFVPNFFVALFLVVFARWHQPGLYGYVVIGVSADCWLRLVGFQHLRHTHMPFYYPASLNRFLISPSAHQLHHSSEERHFDRNFGNILAIWDHLFGTYIAPSREDRYRLGLAGGEEREYRHAVHLLLLLPIVKAARVCLSGVGKPLEGLKRLFAA